MFKAQIQKDKNPSMPFSMIESMMPLFPYIAIIGWMMVLISFLIGLFVLSPAETTFFSDAKAIREATGQNFIDANQLIHVIETWLPEFKFLGLGLGLMGITMALGTIAKRLRIMGKVMTYYMPEDIRPATPEIPKRVKLFQISTMMGVMILMITLFIGLFLAFGAVSTYWSNPIVSLNAATAGSSLLNDYGLIATFKFWLGPLRMMGMSFLFLGITIALTVIIGSLKLQVDLLNNFKTKAKQR